MNDSKLELFIHVAGEKPKVLVAASGETLRDVLTRNGIIRNGQKEVFVFVGESEEALKEADEVENGADEQAPVDLGLTLELLDLKRHRHVHCHECRHIAVEVNFGPKTKHRKFSPATTIEVVTRWARRKFHLDPAAAAEYVLELCGTDEQPRSDRHLGELVHGTKCAVCFDLVKEVTPQG